MPIVNQNFNKSSFLISNHEIILSPKGNAKLVAKLFSKNSSLIPPNNFFVPKIPDVPCEMAELFSKLWIPQNFSEHQHIRQSNEQPAIVLRN